MIISSAHMKEFAGNTIMNFKVYGVREFHWRLHVGTWLVKLAAIIIWMDCEVSFERKQHPTRGGHDD